MSTEQAAKVEAKGENKDGQVADEAGTQPASSAHKGATDHTHTRKRKQWVHHQWNQWKRKQWKQHPASGSFQRFIISRRLQQLPPFQHLDLTGHVRVLDVTSSSVPAVAAAAATPAVAAAAATVAAAAAVLRTAVATHAVATEDEHGLTEDEQLQIDRDLLDSLLEESELLMQPLDSDPTPTAAAYAAAGAPRTQPTTPPAAMPRTSPPRSMYRSDLRSSRPRTSPPWMV